MSDRYGFRGHVHQTMTSSNASATPASRSSQRSSIETLSIKATVGRMMREGAGKLHRTVVLASATLAALLIAGCASTPSERSEQPTTPTPPQSTRSVPAGSKSTSPAAPTASASPAVVFTPADWADLPGWRDDDAAEAWPAFVAGCTALARRDAWREVCAAANSVTAPDAAAARGFFEQHFTPYRVASDTADEGLITGYYEALLRGSRTATERYRYPVYRVPDDLVVVDLASVYPDLKSMRLRGRLEGRRLTPYYDRATIDSADAPLRGNEIAWVDDPFDLFFLHIQGSGRISLESGETIRVGYAEQNGYPYVPIGRVLIERGELAREEVSMQSIKAWLQANRSRSAALLNSNPSYVFFRELPAVGEGPPGALGVPLTPRRSIAVDARDIPLGAPVFISTRWPESTRALDRLVFAQDTGGAIRGVPRADFSGAQAKPPSAKPVA